MLFWCKKVETSCALASKNRDSCLLRRDTVWGGVQWKIACCSSWSSAASHKSQVGENLGIHVAASKQRVWIRCLKRATLWMTPRGRTSSQGLFWGQCTPSGLTYKWKFCCCVLVGSHQNRLSKTPVRVALWGPQQNDWGQWAHSPATGFIQCCKNANNIAFFPH
jgi:hypothetical protein